VIFYKYFILIIIEQKICMLHVIYLLYYIIFGVKSSRNVAITRIHQVVQWVVVYSQTPYIRRL